MIIITRLFNKAIKFLKETYPPRLRKFLLTLLAIGLTGIFLVSGYQSSTLGQRITTRELEVKSERQHLEEIAKQNAEEAQRKYDLCQKTKASDPIAKYINPCRTVDFLRSGLQVTSLDMMILGDEKLQDLRELKRNIESGSYYLMALALFVWVLGLIFIIRITILLGKFIWKKGGSTTTETRSELIKMSAFQKYSLVLS